MFVSFLSASSSPSVATDGLDNALVVLPFSIVVFGLLLPPSTAPTPSLVSRADATVAKLARASSICADTIFVAIISKEALEE